MFCFVAASDARMESDRSQAGRVLISTREQGCNMESRSGVLLET